MTFSTRLLRKGVLIHEARAILAGWVAEDAVPENIDRASSSPDLLSGSESWRREILASVRARLGRFHAKEIAALAAVARSRVDTNAWTACWYWHCAHSDPLYMAFVQGWLYPGFTAGVHRIRTEHVQPFVVTQVERLRPEGGQLSDYGTKRLARDLLRMATECGLLTGDAVKEFVSYSLADECFLYVLHALLDQGLASRAILESPGWRVFLMDVGDVERELLRLHQFRKLHYEVAGTMVNLDLPFPSAVAYAKEISG
jgi:Putative inner membrane protein (DUF1819)